MKRLKILICFILALTITFASVACTDTPDDSGSEGPVDFGDWTNWGLDDWASGSYEEFDPSQNYNKTDWSKDYPGLNSQSVTDVSKVMKFFDSNHVQLYQAEKADLKGYAGIESNEKSSGGQHVGSLRNSSITYAINAEKECDVLLVGAFSMGASSKYGYLFSETFTCTLNGEAVNAEDSWIKKTDGWTDFKETVIGKIHLNKGENVLYFYSPEPKTNLDYIKLIPQGEVSAETLEFDIAYDYKSGLVVQAENVNYTPECKVQGGATGAVLSYTSQDTLLSFVINSDSARTVSLYVNAVIGTVDSTAGGQELTKTRISVKVNGTAVDLGDRTLSCSTNASWWVESYRNYEIATVSLQEGKNDIVIGLSNNLNVDFFSFDKVIYNYSYPAFEYEEGLRVEAEETSYENATPQTNLNTEEGTVLSSLKETTKIRFVVTSNEIKEVGLFVNALIRVDSNNSGKANDRFTLKVNGAEIDLSSITLSGVTSTEVGWWLKEYSNASLGKIKLLKGENFIELTPSKEMNIDYFTFSETMVAYPSFGYKEDLRVEAEDAYYNLILRNGGSGKILGYDSKIKDPQIKFVVTSKEAKEVELFLNAVIRVDDDYSGKASDRFTLKVNGGDVDLSSITIKGATHDNGGWYQKPYEDLSFGKISLKKGDNLIEITTSSEMNVDYFYFNKKTALYATFDYEENLKVEGENTTYSGLIVQNAASGKVLADFKTSSSVKFIVKCDEEKQVEFIINALIRVGGSFSSNADERFTLKVNGTAVDLSAITINGAQDQSENRWWTQPYSDLSLGNISLKKGENVIEIASLSTDLNVDYFLFS